MPVMDGVEATRRIRALPGEAGRIPIIGLTANVMHQEQARYLGAGMDECLMKPIEWDRLAAAIARHASTSRRGQGADGAWAEDAPPIDPADVPLMEERQIASLRDLGSEAEFMQMMHNIMESVQRMLDEILATAETAPKAAAAHRLKGSAGMGGLARVSAIAGSLEDALADGHDVRGFQRELAESVQETRAALVGAGRLVA
jgi:two-component system, sensor histidine kinase